MGGSLIQARLLCHHLRKGNKNKLKKPRAQIVVEGFLHLGAETSIVKNDEIFHLLTSHIYYSLFIKW